MHVDGRTVESGTTIESDICIVGAGAAGIAIAKRLAGTSLDVCLLESGGIDGSNGAQPLSEGTQSGLPYYTLVNTQRRNFGGSTSAWGGYCAPLQPIDFRKRPWIPHSGWPIDRSELRPYYEDAQEVLQLGPFQYDAECWEENIKDYRRLLPGSPAISSFAIQFSNSPFWTSGERDEPYEPTRMGDEYRRDVVGAENVTVVTNATVTEVLTPPSANTVTDLQVECLDGNAFRVNAHRYILACGGIQNARLLLLSNRHAPRGLGNENGLVGRFFMEHPHVPSAAVSLSTSLELNAYRRYYSKARSPRFYLRVSPQRQEAEKILNCSARIDTRSSGVRAVQCLVRRFRERQLRSLRDVSETLKDVRCACGDFEGALSGLKSELSQTAREGQRFRRFNLLTISEQAPNPESRIQLSQDRDKLGQPKAELNWQLTELDRRSITRLNTILGKELERMGMGRLRIPEWLQRAGWDGTGEKSELNRFWWPENPERVSGVWHHIGTTRMKRSPQNGVCNANCRVFGIDNLYVAGSSVFPTSGSAPPTLTIVALSLRLADHIHEETKNEVMP